MHFAGRGSAAPCALATWFAVLATVLPAPARAEIDFDSRGELGAEARLFWPSDDEAVRDATDAGNVAAVGRLQLDAETDYVSARGRGFLRLDPYDDDRTRVFPEELYLSFEYEIVRLRLGYQMLNWTATEAFHPADIINSRLLDGNFENPEKLGELIGALRVDVLEGNVELFVMPLFTEPVLPSARSRLNLGPPGVALGDALILERGGDVDDRPWQLQWGARVQQTVGDADFSLHVVQHIDRSQPLAVVDPASLTPHPLYQALTQVGGTYQHVIDRTIFKLEAAYRHFARPDGGMTDFGPVPRRDHVLAAIGLEHGISTFDSQDTSLLLEGQVLIPTQDDFPELAEPLFEHDVLLGVRHAFNDEPSTTLLLTAIVDAHHPDELVISGSFSRRLGEVFSLSTGVRLLFIPPKDESAPVLYERLNAAHQIYLDLRRHF